MFSIENISFLNDIARLPKSVLKEVCTNLNIPDEGSKYDLAENVWKEVNGNYKRQKDALSFCEKYLLSGQTSATWFQTDGSLKGSCRAIVDKVGFDPFSKIKMPKKSELTSNPVLVCGAKATSNHDYYLRFMYKSGVKRNLDWTDMEVQPKSSIATVYINENAGIVEVRGADLKKSEEIVSNLSFLLSGLLSQEISFTSTDIISPFNQNVGEIADILGGDLLDTDSRPEMIFDEITQEEAKAIVSILSALDSYFEEEDIDKLADELKQANEIFGEDILGTPFTALILAGLDKVGMGVSERDLRGTPLYDYLRPYLQHQGGFVKFSVDEDGITHSYTIRVGFSTNSIYFVRSNSTESVIKFVRDRVIMKAASLQKA